MVQISGAGLRALREQQGLTQLYLATAVGVTTETISRWERQEAPTLKEENGVKLAEVLAVSLQELSGFSDAGEETIAPETAVTVSPKRKSIPILPGVFLLGALAIGLAFFLTGGGESAHFSAKRIIPAHSASGRIFPVLIQVELDPNKPIALLLKEELPPECSVVHTMPQATAVDHDFIKWVARDMSGSQVFSYLARCVAKVEDTKEFHFTGSLLVRQSRRQEISVAGGSTLIISTYHWADTDMNNVIDDEELLAVYDDFDLVKGLNLDVEEVESIWMGSGYSWNKEQASFEIIP